jgi:hypothetical protein
MDKEAVIVVQETEYTGAGKHPLAQLNLARRMGVDIRRGDPAENRPGEAIVIPEQPGQIGVKDVDLLRLRRSYLRNALEQAGSLSSLGPEDFAYLADETRLGEDEVKRILEAETL